jgi:hypothetical protein
MRMRTALLGQDEALSARFLGTGFLLMLALVVSEVAFGLGTWLGSGVRVYVFWLLLVALSAAVAYLNDGLLISILVAMLVDFGYAPGGGLFGPVSPIEMMGYLMLSAVIMGLPLGILGYVVGVAAKYMGRLESVNPAENRAK